MRTVLFLLVSVLFAALPFVSGSAATENRMDSISTRAQSVYRLYKQARQADSIHQALIYLEEYERLNEQLIDINREMLLQRSQELYDYYQKENELSRQLLTQNIEKSNRNIGILALAISFIVLLLAGVLVYLVRMHRPVKKSIITTAAGGMLKNSSIYKKYHLYLRNVSDGNPAGQPTESDKQLLIETVEKACPNFAGRIIQLYSGISEDELYLCYLCKIDINSPVMISRFLHISPNSVTMKRNRLYEKLFNEAGNKKRFEGFIDSLG